MLSTTYADNMFQEVCIFMILNIKRQISLLISKTKHEKKTQTPLSADWMVEDNLQPINCFQVISSITLSLYTAQLNYKMFL